MAAIAISATHTILVTRVNHKLSSPNSIEFTNRAFLPVSISWKPLRAVLSSSAVSIEELAAGTGNNSLTLRELCQGHVPEHVLRRMDETGYVLPTDIQREALPVLFSSRDCILHAQTGSGKTLTYLLLIFSLVNAQRSAVQAVIVVPTRELGMQVTKVARVLAAKPSDTDLEHKPCTVMALLDGGMLRRHKSWLKAEPPTIVVATMGSLCQLIEKHIFKLESVQVLVIDEICGKKMKYQTLLSLIQSDAPESGIIFVGEQSEKSKKAGNAPSTTLLVDFLSNSYKGSSDVLLLEEEMNFNSRAASLLEVRQGGGYLLVSTDIAARGIDLPETTHIYNFDLPRSAIDYLHRAGRTGRKPFSDEKWTVTSIITSEELFVLQRYENELKFKSEELTLQTQC
ncbi:DEAD-box ATP-dependent RNA helicase 58 [Citrus sinensis]|uniref:DEAD-box ATP-dependent RNA helicase 58, chloroplastic isoform X4 n=1 Tax=Citrus sinensis TaxID=2711 RepID=UPI0007639B80|nr:DEAD-box ATP-dependent RNA helicase 58, chloroplastic isoform X4 [Citrus sinensis]KAH9765216.1 DEAD-box ATP-dependent RNA helicase 58 [Citrus sinensis]